LYTKSDEEPSPIILCYPSFCLEGGAVDFVVRSDLTLKDYCC